MAVQPASLEVLEKAAVPPAQARAIVQAIEIEIAGAKDTLATKQDGLILRHELREKLSRSEFQAAMARHVRHTYGAIMGAIMGQFALLLGAAYLFVTHVQR